jgi:hypothetical protein
MRDTRIGDMGEPTWLERVVEWYEKEPGDALVGEQPLRGIRLAELQKLWSLPPGDPMVLCYPVSEAQRPYIEAHAGIQLRLDDFDYFLVCLTNDLDATLRDGGYMGQFPAPKQWGRDESIQAPAEPAKRRA